MTNRENTPICLLEHDLNGDTLVTWSYPGVPSLLQSLCIDKFNTHHVAEKGTENISFLFFKVKSDWVYMDLAASRKEVFSEITASALCVVSKVFNPEKYKALLGVLHEQFLASGDPTKILEGYLSIYASEKFKSFDMSNFLDSSAMLAVSCVKDIVRWEPFSRMQQLFSPKVLSDVTNLYLQNAGIRSCGTVECGSSQEAYFGHLRWERQPEPDEAPEHHALSAPACLASP